MKKNEARKIKRLKKIHVFPHLFILLIFLIFISIAISGSVEVFFSQMMESHLRGAKENAQLFADYLNEHVDEDYIAEFDATALNSVYAPKDFGIYDNSKSEFVVAPKAGSELSELLYYEFGDMRVLFDRGEFLESEFEVNTIQFTVGTLLKLGFRQLDIAAAFDMGDMNDKLCSLHGWIVQPLDNDEYSLYYDTDVVLLQSDLVHIVTFVITIILSVSIPIIFYLILLIMSVVGQKRTARLLYFDMVTGGRNWTYFRERAERLMKRNWRGIQYVMVSLRMDRYQGFCACYGPVEGEEAIARMYQVLNKSVKRRREALARYSEAEFCMLLQMESSAQITQRMETIRERLVKVMEPHKIDFTIGLCEVTPKTPTDLLYSNAGIARKSIPQNASEKHYWFNEKLKEDQLWERFVEENMETALKEGQLHVYLQPKYNAKTKRLGGAEALIRWISPTEGFIGPGKFIPIFEENGFITKIDDFMISSVAKLQAKWVAEGKNVVPISVNVSRAHFTQPDLAEHICSLVESAGAPKELIELELTESAFFEDKDMLICTVEKLKSMGFSVSMDDFGAGYSSLNSLKDLQLDVLKIDADFFRGREENEERGSLIVSETIQLAKNLGMTTVAEGIESADQVDFLATHGCDLIQGFYFAKPMPVTEYEERMESDRNAS